MNDIQIKVNELQEKGWTLAALADELGVTINAVEKWKAGDRYPANAKSVFLLLAQLLTRKRVPKQRRYGTVFQMKNRIELQEEKHRLEEEISELNLKISKLESETDRDSKLSWTRDNGIQVLVKESEKKQIRLKEIDKVLG
jgi:transcriptional regulator with XRE-family HTH domain